MFSPNQLPMKCPICRKYIVSHGKIGLCVDKDHEYAVHDNGFSFRLKDIHFSSIYKQAYLCINEVYHVIDKKFNRPKNSEDISVIINKCLTLINFK